MGTASITTIEVGETKIRLGDPNGQNFQELQLEVDTGPTTRRCPAKCSRPWGSQLKHQCSPAWPTAAWR